MEARTKVQAPAETVTEGAVFDLALERLLAKQLGRKEIPEGKYLVEGRTTINIRAEVSQGASTTYTPTADIPLLATMAILLRRLGVRREDSTQLILDAASEAVASGTKVEAELAQYEQDLDDALSILRNRLSRELPKKTRKGALRVTGCATVESSAFTITAS